MEISPNNIKFEYLHRDEGNYKIFGELIFSNEKGLKIEEATKILQSKLIDKEYFYPGTVKIPLFPEHSQKNNDFSDWYEFQQFSFTKEEPTEIRSLEEFINSFKA